MPMKAKFKTCIAADEQHKTAEKLNEAIVDPNQAALEPRKAEVNPNQAADEPN